MRQFLRRQLGQFTRDDLFLRVFSLLGGIWFGGLGIAMTVAGASEEFRAALSWFNLLYWPIAILFTAWGGLLVSRCLVPARTRIARFIEKALPNPADLEDAALALVVLVVPAALLTLLLRLIGIRGQR